MSKSKKKKNRPVSNSVTPKKEPVLIPEEPAPEITTREVLIFFACYYALIFTLIILPMLLGKYVVTVVILVIMEMLFFSYIIACLYDTLVNGWVSEIED